MRRYCNRNCHMMSHVCGYVTVTKPMRRDCNRNCHMMSHICGYKSTGSLGHDSVNFLAVLTSCLSLARSMRVKCQKQSNSNSIFITLVEYFTVVSFLTSSLRSFPWLQKNFVAGLMANSAPYIASWTQWLRNFSHSFFLPWFSIFSSYTF